MRHIVCAIIIVGLATAAVLAATPAGPRVTLTVGQVTITPDDSFAVVPVYLSCPLDSMAGVEFTLAIPENQRIHFPNDEGRPNGLPLTLDTSGTLMSGWEWIAATSPSKNLFDIRVMGLADYPDSKVTPPPPPQNKALLAKIVLRMDKADRLAVDSLIPIRVVAERCSFSDPRGTSLGIKTTETQKCEQYVGDSCLSWKTVRVGTRDTTEVKLKGGAVHISEAVKGKP